jgi:short-subunit dehydrogenase
MNKNKQIALITGASSGIGAEIAKQLAKKNIHTIITARSLSRLIKTEKSIIDDGGTCTVVELDMKDLHGLDNLGIEIFKRWGKLDILIANAAILGTLGPIHHQSSDEFLEVMMVNSISNHRLIRSCDALLKKSHKPKACFLTSSVAVEARAFWGAYAVSKASLEHMIKIWSAENKHNNLSISIINPGKTNTRIRNQAMPGENIENLQNPNEVAKIIIEIIFLDKLYKGDTIDVMKLN